MFNFRSRSANDELFNSLVNEYREKIYWFVRRRLGSHEDADDVVQEVFIRVFKNIDKLREPKAAKSWIFKIAANETTRFVEQNRKDTVPISEEMEHSLTAGEYVDLSNEAARLFQEAFQKLSQRQQTVFELRYYQEFSYEDIAEQLNSNVATMKSTYHIAKQKITEYVLANGIYSNDQEETND